MGVHHEMPVPLSVSIGRQQAARNSLRASSSRTTGGHWTDLYARRLALTDIAAIGLALAGAYLFHVWTRRTTIVNGELQPSYLLVTLVIAGAWLVSLSLWRTRDRRRIGFGNSEYVRVFHATWKIFASVAILAYLLRMEIGRGFIAAAVTIGLSLLLASRYLWRQWLHARRAEGDYVSPIVIIGHRSKATELIDLFHSNPSAGFAVVGVCVPHGAVAPGEQVNGVSVLGSMDDAARVAVAAGAHAVAVSGSDTITTDAVRRLGWDLEGKRIDLALTTTLLDVAGPRMHMQPVNGLPLTYVDEPRFTGRKYVAKTVFDTVGAALLIVLLSPVLVVIGVLVGATSTGAIFYQQERVGRNGRTFRMLKFRSMVVDAHERLAEVLAREGVDGVGLYYKPKNDPRVTTVGRFIRRYSLDELPQLFNVLRGEMSLVGPRPQIRAEVEQYDRAAHRRLLVKPGLTGLWQVSGRNSLSVTESIRMDVNYVENWTLFGDVTILARTFRAMIGGAGAY